ncbi:MAG: hypothetical protein HY924_16220 [Elusimicrobia bacterium]|nr:hypothetical protein [Elusimicrobiota bacterium]
MVDSILDRIGFCGLLWVLWRATPWARRLLALPYNVAVYRGAMASSSSLGELYDCHAALYRRSLLFRLLRPRFSDVRKALAEGYRVR